MNPSIKTVLITGITSGIGKCIFQRLLAEGCNVIGVVRNEESKQALLQELASSCEFVRLETADLARTTEIEALAKRIHAAGIHPDTLILNAGVGYYGPHEELSAAHLATMTAVNFTAPLLLTNLFLRDIKAAEGHILFTSSITAGKTNNTHGCAYGATKAGITSFAKSLFEEVRKYGVRITVLTPDLTRTDLYRNASFTACDEEDTALTPEEVADYAMFALSARDGMNLTELIIQPQRHKLLKK